MRLPRSVIVAPLASVGLLLAANTHAGEPAEGSPDEAEQPAETDTEVDKTDGEEDAEEEEKPAAAEVAAEAAATTPTAGQGDEKEVAAPTDDGEGEDEEDEPAVSLSGYVLPGFGLRFRPEALPRDELEHGFFGRAGLIVTGRPADMWSGTVHLVLGAATGAFQKKLRVLTGISIGDDSHAESSVLLTKLFIDEATVAFDPFKWLGVKAGVLRIPFNLQQQSPNTALMFPDRSGPNEVFLSGSDIGALVYSDIGDGIFRPSVGVFNGDSLGMTFDFVDTSGIVISARADVNPFGAFPFDEGGVQQGDFRLGAGFGVLYRPATLYDENTGYEFTNVHDVRMAASLRMAVAGLYVGAEYLRRQQTDDFTSRPRVADGAYAQLSYYWHIADPVAVEPIARVGFVAEDQAFDPRLTGWVDAGLSFYPAADAEQPNAVRLTLQYLGERRFTEQEDAHGGTLSARLLF